MVSYVIMVSYIIIIGHHGLLGKYTQYQHVRRWVCPWVSPVQRAGVTSWEGRGKRKWRGNASLDWSPWKYPLLSSVMSGSSCCSIIQPPIHPSIPSLPGQPPTHLVILPFTEPSIHPSFFPPFELRPTWKGPAKSWGRVLGGEKSKDIGLRLEWAWWIYRSAWPGSSWDETRLQGGWDQIRWTWSANGGFWICFKCEKSLEGFEQDSGVLLFPFHQDCSEWWKDCGGRSRERG